MATSPRPPAPNSALTSRLYDGTRVITPWDAGRKSWAAADAQADQHRETVRYRLRVQGTERLPLLSPAHTTTKEH